MVYFEFFDDDDSMLIYSLDLEYAFVSRETKYGYSCNFITSKLNNGIVEVETIEICQVMVSTDEIAIVFNRKNIPEIIAESRLIGGELTSISSHAHVIYKLAIPYWMSVAVHAFNYRQIDDIAWILITNLWEQSQLETDASWDSRNRRLSLPLSEKNYWMAIIESLKQIPSNQTLLERLSGIPKEYEKLIPPQLKNNKITNPIEQSFEERFMDERKSAGNRF